MEVGVVTLVVLVGWLRLVRGVRVWMEWKRMGWRKKKMKVVTLMKGSKEMRRRRRRKRKL
jgi:hypothetical protein